MKEIPITEIENLKIGNAQDIEGGTGCTVLLCARGMPAGLDVRGGGPASRESQLLSPLAAAEAVHAVLLSGGSAFGLDAAGGVMRYLAERDVGFDTGITKVPLVCASCLFDLVVGSPDARPDAKMAYAACRAAEQDAPEEGNFGAGTGATVGKYHGPATMMKSGLGIYAVQLGDLKVGAVVAVNALGDVFDIDSGRRLAGMLTPDLSTFADTERTMYTENTVRGNLFTGNTTIGAVITNARFDKTKMNKIAAMAHNGYARALNPVNTTADGDSIYALSVGDVQSELNLVGTLAARVMGKAVARAVLRAEPAYGLKTAQDFL